MLDSLLKGKGVKLYMVRSLRVDWQSQPSEAVIALSQKVYARHFDINSMDSDNVTRMMREIVEDLLHKNDIPSLPDERP